MQTIFGIPTMLVVAGLVGIGCVIVAGVVRHGAPPQSHVWPMVVNDVSRPEPSPAAGCAIALFLVTIILIGFVTQSTVSV